MKNTKVKGFTLIELLVVMAIFGIIMAGAIQLIPSVTKMMVQSTYHEEGNAAVNSIARYLESELAPAEYLTVTNYVSDEEELVKDFILSYYEGVLANGSGTEPGTQAYGKGKVHVMTIDNNNNGRITKRIYDVNFDIQNDPNPIASKFIIDQYPKKGEAPKIAVNKAYYDAYDFTIVPGPYVPKEEGEEEEEEEEEDVHGNLIDGITAGNTNFHITATTKRKVNGTHYSFSTNASMSLTNIHHRHGGPVEGRYFVIDQAREGSEIVNTITDITRDDPTPISSYTPEFTLSRHKGYVATGMKMDYRTPDAADKGTYVFVYSYSTEIKT